MGSDLSDLFFGEALFRAYQGQYFDALQRLDTELALYRGLDEPQLDKLHYHINDAEFSVGDFELNYRMHLRAGRAIKGVLEGAVDPAIRNEAAFRLARIHFQNGELEDALHALARIEGTIPVAIKDDVEFLRANIYMATGRANDAVKVLEQLHGSEQLAGFTAYNLGIALLQDGRPKEAIEQLDKAGMLQTAGPAGIAIRDKSNLVLGTILFETGSFERARLALDRVHLDGPFSNQALLRAGFSEASNKEYARALVPWTLLVDRDPTDSAVQEAILAVPHAYASLNLHALIREESRQDDTWVIRLRNQPDAPETYYLMDLLASHDFQTALHNYLDLEDLQSRLTTWQTSLAAFDDIIALRAQNYDPLLPGVDEQFRELDTRMRLRLAQRKHLTERLKAMLTSPRPENLATSEERIAGEQIAAIEKKIGNSTDPESLALLQRAARLRGALSFRQETEYSKRLTEAYKHLTELTVEVNVLTKEYDDFVRARQAATHSYVGYDAQIAGLRDRVGSALKRVETLMDQQGKMIESAAIHQLEVRRDRMLVQQTESRYGVADSYDRAARAQSDMGDQ
jgi:tetratricopeptide (TPR) repeat protein